MQKFNRRFGSFGQWKGKVPAPCLCDFDGYCQNCEHIAQSQIRRFNDLVDRDNSTEWDTGQQNTFIKLLEFSNPFSSDRGTEAIWATIVLRQAYDVADWMVEKGYTSYEPLGHYCCDEDDNMCVPYDASTWRHWIKRELCSDKFISNEHIKSVTVHLVRRKHIKIPLNSGLPLYYWILNGYRIADSCRIFTCIEYIYHDRFNFHEIEMSLKHHMDQVIKAKTGFRLIYVMYVCGTGEEFEDVYTVKVLEKVILMYRDRKRSSAAIKIQCLFRNYRSKKMVDAIRVHPDNLFDPDHSKARQNIFSIDTTRFAPTL